MSAIEKIENHPQKPKLLKMLRAQLAKDLNLQIDAVPESGLMPWLHSHLMHLIDKGVDLPQLLYRIDLPEGLASESTEVLGQRIVLREAEKVLFRWQYSN